MHFDLLRPTKKLLVILIFVLFHPSSPAVRSAIVIASRNNSTSTFSIDNAVVGEPRLECGAGFITLRFRTHAHFMGRIFVKGMASAGHAKAVRRSCEVRASDACVPLRSSRYSTSTSATAIAPSGDSRLRSRSRGHHAWSKYTATRRAVENHSNKHFVERLSDPKNHLQQRHRVSRREAATNDAIGGDECAMRVLFDGDERGGCTPLTRQRSLNPRGVAVTATIVVSFHPLFITQIDRMYRLQCFYRNQGGGGPDLATMAMVKAGFHVNGAASSLTGPPTPSLSMPICRYEVLDDGPDGQPVTYASLRSRLYHRWSCATADASAFCFRVHSCYARAAAEDGRGRVAILNGDGCAVDRFLLDNLSYAANETSLTAGQFAQVYKYADEESLYFQCQIRVWRRKTRGAKCWVENCPEPKPFGSFTSGNDDVAEAGGFHNYVASSARRRIRRLTAPEEGSLQQLMRRKNSDNSDETDEQFGGDVDVSAEIRVIEDLEQF